MTSDLGETFKELKKLRQEKRASNRDNSAEYLTAHGIVFTSNNGGAHLIVEGNECFIDFWPGTGRWNSRCGKKGFGVRNLVKFINAHNLEMIYGYGIVDKDGAPWWDADACVCKDREPMETVAENLNEEPDERTPYRVVQLTFRCKRAQSK